MVQKNSLKIATYLLGLVRLLFYFEIGIAGILFASILFSVIEDGGLLYSWDIYLPLDTVKTNNSPNAQVVIDSGNLTANISSPWFYSLVVLDGIITMGLLLLGTHLLLKVFRNLRAGQPFHRSNSRYLKGVGLISLVYMGYTVVQQLIYKQTLLSYVNWQEAEVIGFGNMLVRDIPKVLFHPIHLNWEAAFAGLVILLLSEIFRIGADLNTENQSFV